MSMQLQPDDPRLSWEGAISLQRGAEWVQPWRLPFDDRTLFHEALVERAAMPAGVRLTFRSDTDFVGGSVVAQPEAAPIECYCDGQFAGSQPLDGRDRFRFDGLPPGDKLIELWLPQFGPFRLRALELADGARLERHDDRRPRWITYGSSITHCRTAAGPSFTWPAIVARERGLHLTCLGFGGQCHLDPLVARIMRDRPADFLSMKVGINIYGASSLNVRTFRPGIIAFVQLVREQHPDVPFVVISPIFSPPRETAPNAVGFTLEAMRQEVALAVETLRAHGDRRVYYVDGRSIFGPDLAHLLPDNLHPNAEGYKAMGRNFLREVVARYFPPGAPPRG